ERADLDADLTAHANRNVDVECRRIKLRLAPVIGLLVFALNNIDALWRAFLLANLAGDTAQAGFGVFAIVNEERKIAVVLRQWVALFRILHRDQAILFEVTADEVPRSDSHPLENSDTNHMTS